MGSPLHTLIAVNAHATISQILRDALTSVDALDFDGAHHAIARATDGIPHGTDSDTDQVHNEIFVLRALVKLVTRYVDCWRTIITGNFADAWPILQDALDQVRAIKKFSSLDVGSFEEQLLALESAYPYRLFASIGAVVERCECCICGEDIDGEVCPHRRGELYRGKVAFGIAREIKAVDHVALVYDPDDKRCVVSLTGTAAEFPVVRYIADRLQSRELRIGSFAAIEWSTRIEPNPDYVVRGRNQPCYCGSGRKFKRCCAGKRHVERKHAQVQAVDRQIATLVV